jgi:membrane protein DedA with SNARE-associated domain
MINDIAIVIILVLVGIGALISLFLLGRWSGQMRFYKKYNEIVSKNKRLERDNQYLKEKAGLNNLNDDDMGGK